MVVHLDLQVGEDRMCVQQQRVREWDDPEEEGKETQGGCGEKEATRMTARQRVRGPVQVKQIGCEKQADRAGLRQHVVREYKLLIEQKDEQAEETGRPRGSEQANRQRSGTMIVNLMKRMSAGEDSLMVTCKDSKTSSENSVRETIIGGYMMFD